MKLRLLVADNDLKNLLFYKEALEERGYHVEIAHSPDEARQMFSTKNFHLVLMDRRLTDDDRLDRSGEALAIELAGPIPILIFTSFELENPFAATDITARGNIEYVDKNEGFATVLTKIENIIAKHVSWNTELQIFGYTIAQMVAALEPSSDDAAVSFSKGDIERLFHGLFQSQWQRKLTVTHIPVAEQPYIIAHVATERDDGYLEYFLLLCGQREAIRQAQENYKSFGMRNRTTMLMQHAVGRRYGALLFDGNGVTAESVMPLRTACQQPHLEFGAIWDTIATTTLRAYRFTGTTIRGSAVIDAYNAYLKLQNAALTQRTFDAVAQKICGRPLEGRYKIQFIDQQLVLHATGEQLHTVSARIDMQRITPNLSTIIGQVNPAISLDQILIDSRSYHNWLLNYAHFDKNAPLFAPFATLELDVKQEMFATAQVSLDERYRFEEALAHATNLYAPLDNDSFPPVVRRTLYAIESIRRSVGDRLHVDHMNTYHTSVFFAALAKLVQFLDREQLGSQQQQLFHAQLFICGLLAYKALQPSTFIREGLWINHKRRQLFHDDRLITLTPGEYDLVELLARTPGEICSYWTIVCTLIQPSLKELEREFGAKGLSSYEIKQQQHDIYKRYRNAIDPKVSRIRDAIGDEPPFRFLVSQRSVGLKLMLDGTIDS